jgi:hypothetical protein
MVASGVLLVVFSMFFTSLLSASTAGEITNSQALAVTRVMSVVEEIHGLDTQSLLTYVPPQCSGLGVWERVQISVIDSSGTEIAIPVSGSESEEVDVEDYSIPNPCNVKVTITWADEAERTYAMTVSTLHRS